MGYKLIKYKNYDAVKLFNSRYCAIIIYGRGCNLIEFNDISNNLSFLHYPEPEEAEEFEEACQRFGSAVLFPPNKVRNGIIHWDNRTYDLVSNQLPRAHGILKEFPFEIVFSYENETESIVKFRFNSLGSIYHNAFGWNFTCSFTFTLSENGITQLVDFENNGETDIPFGLGFHTAFRIPQNDCFTKDDYRIFVSSAKQWELDENGFPTGNLIFVPDGYNNGCLSPLAAPLADHLQACALSEDNSHSSFHCAKIRNVKTNTELIYETDSIFANWMVWNKNASDNFVCIEPMTCIIDAPNAKIPQDLHGFISLKPHEHREAKNRLYVKS